MNWGETDKCDAEGKVWKRKKEAQPQSVRPGLQVFSPAGT